MVLITLFMPTAWSLVLTISVGTSIIMGIQTHRRLVVIMATLFVVPRKIYDFPRNMVFWSFLPLKSDWFWVDMYSIDNRLDFFQENISNNIFI